VFRARQTIARSSGGALDKSDRNDGISKWDHSLGHDRLTAEHNTVVDAVETLAKVLREVERSVALPDHERDMVRAALVKCRAVTLQDELDQWF
jgi:hypothetical protein